MRKAIYLLSFLLIFLLLISGWMFLPYQNWRFETVSGNPNFSLYNYGKEEMQFYKNMRFSDSRISYRIENCPLQKTNDMKRSFEIISNLTLLSFYQKTQDEEIMITCKERTVVEGNLFIAGEGGPTKIISEDNFNVILNGEILLLRQSDCPAPNVGIHELLHVLGFNHSANSNNIMYPISRCGQTIGDDAIELLNNLYLVPSSPDLSLSNASAIMHGRYIDLNFTIKNDGLKKSKPSLVNIYADDKIIKEIDVNSLDIGQGLIVTLTNIGTAKVSVQKIKVEIDYSSEELNKNNNFVVLKIK